MRALGSRAFPPTGPRIAQVPTNIQPNMGIHKSLLQNSEAPVEIPQSAALNDPESIKTAPKISVALPATTPVNSFSRSFASPSQGVEIYICLFFNRIEKSIPPLGGFGVRDSRCK